MPWIIIGVLQIVTSLYQASIGPQSVTSWGPAYGFALMKFRGYAFRPFGLTSQPGAPAIFTYLCIPFVCYFLFFARSYLTSLLMLFVIPAAGMALMVCQIRSALLKGMIGAVGVAFLYYKNLFSLSRRTKILTLVATAVLILASSLAVPILFEKLTGQNQDTQKAVERSLTLFDYNKVASAREGTLDRFLEYAQMVPWGAGLSKIGAAAGKFQDLIKAEKFFAHDFFADNLWIELVVDLGIPGLIIFNLIIIMIVLRGVSSFRRTTNNDLKNLQWTLLTALGTILIGAYGAEPILYNPEGPFFWFFSGRSHEAVAPAIERCLTKQMFFYNSLFQLSRYSPASPYR